MISRLKPPNVRVLSLTTIATPHRGSAFADYIFAQIGATNLPKLYRLLETFHFETGAFRQLTQTYMAESFNPRTPDLPGVRYYSYGAAMRPGLTSVFRKSHRVIERAEGPNDGLVSVDSSQWGEYKGTLNHVSHLDLINWTNRLRWFIWGLAGRKRNFNAIAFYLDIADRRGYIPRSSWRSQRNKYINPCVRLPLPRAGTPRHRRLLRGDDAVGDLGPDVDDGVEQLLDDLGPGFAADGFDLVEFLLRVLLRVGFGLLVA
ncbi:hypothetical protein MRB53_042399 [Persea americana]|nr:hypothetical protein MRB53_042399 [Persea americana]